MIYFLRLVKAASFQRQTLFTWTPNIASFSHFFVLSLALATYFRTRQSCRFGEMILCLKTSPWLSIASPSVILNIKRYLRPFATSRYDSNDSVFSYRQSSDQRNRILALNKFTMMNFRWNKKWKTKIVYPEMTHGRAKFDWPPCQKSNKSVWGKFRMSSAQFKYSVVFISF